MEINVGKLGEETKEAIKEKTVIKNVAPRKKKNKTRGKRKILKSSITKASVKEMLDIVKANQKVVDDVVKVNMNMMERVVELSSAVALLTENMSKFLSKKDYEEKPSDTKTDENAENKIKDMEKRLNALLLAVSRVKQ